MTVLGLVTGATNTCWGFRASLILRFGSPLMAFSIRIESILIGRSARGLMVGGDSLFIDRWSGGGLPEQIRS